MEIQAKIRGVRPLLMHNGAGVDNTTDHAKEKAALSKKKPKTPADEREIARLDFVGALYVDEAGKIIIPDVNILAVIIEGAKAFKHGPKAKAGLFIGDHGALNFGDPKIKNDGKGTVEALWESGRYTDRRRARIPPRTGASIMITRPCFKKWSCTFGLDIDEEICNPDDVPRWLEMGGKRSGLGDYRPMFGRFEVEEFAEVKK